MGRIIKYRYHQFASRPMNVGIMVGNMITASDNVEFVRVEDVYAITDEDIFVRNDVAYNVDLVCYEKVGRMPYHVCWHKGKVYVLYGRIEYDTMNILCTFVPKNDGNGYDVVFSNNERYNVSGLLTYDGHCDEVERMFGAYISEQFLKRLPIKKVNERYSYAIGENNEIYVSASIGVGFSYNTMVKYDVGDIDYTRLDMEDKDYISMLNFMYMATTDGKKTCLCEYIDTSLNPMKASTVVVNGMLAAAIADTFESNIGDCCMGIYDPTGNYVFIPEWIRTKFKEYDFWFTPDMIAIAALRLVKRLENSITE